MGHFQDRSLLLEECPRRRGGCRAGARPCAPERQWHRRRRRRGGCCSGARRPCGAAVPGSRGPSPGTPSWRRRLVRMQPRRHDGSIDLWNNPCNVKMSGVAYCSIPPVCATSCAFEIEGWAVGLGGGAFGIVGIASPSENLSVVQERGTTDLWTAGCLTWHSRGSRMQTCQVERTSQAAVRNCA